MANTLTVKEGARVLARVTVQPEGAVLDGTPEITSSDDALVTFEPGTEPGTFTLTTLDAGGGDATITVDWGGLSTAGTLTVEDAAPVPPDPTGLTLDLSEMAPAGGEPPVAPPAVP